MINLLPSFELDNITYARKNSRLRWWIIVLLLGIGGVIVMVGAGVLIIDRSKNQVSQQVAVAQEQLKIEKVDEVQDRVEEIGGSLKLATDVLSKQVIMSKLIQQIARVLPSGTSLSGLQLGAIEGGMDLSVVAKDFQTATQVQVNLRDPANKLFSDADILNISCTGSADPAYPCTASLRVLFVKDSPYTFLGEGSKP